MKTELLERLLEDKKDKDTDTANKDKKSKTRCAQCRKKVPLISFTCKCERIFCMSHQSPHNHSCSYDYQSDRRAHIERTNPKVCPTTLVDPI
jgi:predicted nucleic acid binding AN1-type Zn finger protein